MMQRHYVLKGLNREALHAQLVAGVGAAYGGFADRETPAGFGITVYLNGQASPADIDRLDALLAEHDPQQLTPAQQARRLRQQQLVTARQEQRGADLNPADFAGQSALIQTLARKMAWLEQEIADLRGL
jgi:hypothetical protein